MRKLTWSLIAIALVGLLLFANHYVPFQAPVTVAYAGLGLALVGLVSVCKPLRILRIRSRRVALLVSAVGWTAVLTGLIWPAPMVRSPRVHRRIDDFMPEYQFYEFHQTTVAVPPDRVLRAARQLRLADIPAAVVLMRIRAMMAGHFHSAPRRSRPILDPAPRSGSGFLTLDASGPREIVGAMVGRPWTSAPSPRVTSPEEFMAFREPGYVKVAFNIAVSEVKPGETLLTTETRVVATDEWAHWVFGCYWRAIYPGSAIIRRAWLDAIVAQAESGSP
jgi:hypothetical protein